MKNTIALISVPNASDVPCSICGKISRFINWPLDDVSLNLCDDCAETSAESGVEWVDLITMAKRAQGEEREPTDD